MIVSWFKIDYIHEHVQMYIARKNKNYKDKERLTYVTWRFNTGFSHLMCIASLSLIWYSDWAVSRILKHSTEEASRHSVNALKCLNTCDDLSPKRCSCMHVLKCLTVRLLITTFVRSPHINKFCHYARYRPPGITKLANTARKSVWTS